MICINPPKPINERNTPPPFLGQVILPKTPRLGFCVRSTADGRSPGSRVIVFRPSLPSLTRRPVEGAAASGDLYAGT